MQAFIYNFEMLNVFIAAKNTSLSLSDPFQFKKIISQVSE